MNQPILMLCCAEQTSDCAGQRHDIRLIEMLPKDHPNPAFGPIDWGQLISQFLNGAGMMGGLCQGMPCGRERIVRW